jgi:hypothetical protein
LRGRSTILELHGSLTTIITTLRTFNEPDDFYRASYLRGVLPRDDEVDAEIQTHEEKWRSGHEDHLSPANFVMVRLVLLMISCG